MSTAKKSSFKVITSVATLSYPNLDKPQEGKPGKKAKYSAVFVFEPRHLETAEGKATMAALQAAAVAACETKFGTTFVHPVSGASLNAADAMREGVIRSPFRRDAAAKGYPVGSIFINARTEQKPGCVYPYKEVGSDKPAVIPTDKIREVLYAGAQVRGSLAAFGYDQEGNKGVTFALNNVQFIADGKRLDSRVAADEEFDAVMSEAPADIDSLIG